MQHGLLSIRGDPKKMGDDVMLPVRAMNTQAGDRSARPPLVAIRPGFRGRFLLAGFAVRSPDDSRTLLLPVIGST